MRNRLVSSSLVVVPSLAALVVVACGSPSEPPVGTRGLPSGPSPSTTVEPPPGPTTTTPGIDAGIDASGDSSGADSALGLPDGYVAPPAGRVGKLVGPSRRPHRIISMTGIPNVAWIVKSTGLDVADGEVWKLNQQLANPTTYAPQRVQSGIANLDQLTAKFDIYCFGTPGTSSANYANGYAKCIAGFTTPVELTVAGPAMTGLALHDSVFLSYVARAEGQPFFLKRADFSAPTAAPEDLVQMSTATTGTLVVATKAYGRDGVVFAKADGTVSYRAPNGTVTSLGTVAAAGSLGYVDVEHEGPVTVVCTGSSVVLFESSGASRVLAQNECGQVALTTIIPYFPVKVAGRWFIARGGITGPIELRVETAFPALAIAESYGFLYYSQPTGVFTVER